MGFDFIEQTPVFEDWTLIGKLCWCDFNIGHLMMMMMIIK